MASSILEESMMAADDRGLSCPSCGCHDVRDDRTKVYRVIRLGQHRSIRRHRICRACGRKFITSERVVGDNS